MDIEIMLKAIENPELKKTIIDCEELITKIINKEISPQEARKKQKEINRRIKKVEIKLRVKRLIKKLASLVN